MPAPRKLDPDLSPLHYFGTEFRRAREAARMTQGEFAELVPCHLSIVSRVEAGEITPNGAFIEAISKAFPDCDWLIRFYRSSLRWDTGPVPRWFEDYFRHEQEAHTLRIWQNNLIPGPFQTDAYARELFKVEQPEISDERLDELVEARLRRQDIFGKTSPPNMWVVMDEVVLRRLIGSPKIMHEQLLKLADMSRRSCISVQVIETSSGSGLHPGLAGSFQIASVHGKSDLMLVEAVVEDHTIERTALIQEVTVTFDRLRGYALPCAASRDLIVKVAEENATD